MHNTSRAGIYCHYGDSVHWLHSETWSIAYPEVIVFSSSTDLALGDAPSARSYDHGKTEPASIKL